MTAGTAHKALSSRNVSICGKAGTTKIKDGEYYYEDDMKRALFCGFFPVEKPQYSMIVVLSYIDSKEYEAIGGGRLLLRSLAILNRLCKNWNTTSNAFIINCR